MSTWMFAVRRIEVRNSDSAAVTQPCAAGYSGWFGVTSSGVHAGSAVVAGLPSMSACWIAVTGRQNV